VVLVSTLPRKGRRMMKGKLTDEGSSTCFSKLKRSPFLGTGTTEPYWKYLLARVFGRKVGSRQYWRGRLYERWS